MNRFEKISSLGGLGGSGKRIFGGMEGLNRIGEHLSEKEHFERIFNNPEISSHPLERALVPNDMERYRNAIRTYHKIKNNPTISAEDFDKLLNSLKKVHDIAIKRTWL
jgi:hypothetical protein